MIKTDAVRVKETFDSVTGWRKAIEHLWVSQEHSEWREDNETENSAVSDFSALQVGTAWPFPESST